MINWDKGFASRYYAAIVDPVTWRDLDTFEITGGSIKFSNNGLRESADIQTTTFDHDSEMWIRLYLDARQSDGSKELVPLFTGLGSAPNTSFNGRRQSSTIQCYSVLKPAEDVLLPLGWYLISGSNGARAVYDLLSDVTEAPVVIDGVSPSISTTIVAGSGETRLSLVDYILDVIDWRLRIDGDGTIHICPLPDAPSAAFDADEYDVLELDVSIDSNWAECPNVFRAISDEAMAVARDEDPNSRFSIPNRGREIWAEESSVTLNDSESIGQYAQRRLNELQKIGYSLKYDRRFNPEVKPTDFVSIRYPEQSIGGYFEVISQSIELGYGARVNEETMAL